MKKVNITLENIENQLKKLKINKAPGPDGIKPELYKNMVNSNTCKRALKQSYGKILESGKKSENWETSKTVLTPKTKKTHCKRSKTNCFNKHIVQNFHGNLKRKNRKSSKI